MVVALVAHFWEPLAVWRMVSRASELAQASRDAEAVDLLRAALLVDADNPQTVVRLAQAHRRVGQLEPAANLLSAAKDLGGDEQQIELETTLLSVQMGRTRGFEKRFAELMVQWPDQAPDILRTYVLGLFANLQTDHALQLLKSWESSTPQDSRPKFLQAYLYQGINRLDMAAAAYRAGLKLSREATVMRKRLAEVLLEAGEADEAWSELQTCREQTPGDIEVQYLIAECAHKRNETQTALAELEQVLKTDPNHFQSLRLRGRMRLDSDDPQGALDDLQKAASVQPDDTVVREALGRALQALGRTDEAQSHFDYVASATKQQDETGRLIRQVLSEPQNVDLRFEIGVRLLQAGDFDDGAKWLRTVLEIDPSHVGAHLTLADLLEQRGDFRGAAQHRQAVGK